MTKRIRSFSPKKRYKTKDISLEDIDYDERGITKNFAYEIEHFKKTDSLFNTVFKASNEEKRKPFIYNYFSMLEEFNIELGEYKCIVST